MKLKKKRLMLVSLLVGSTMFATTVLAEIASKSGYEQGKDILKYTAAQLYDGGIQNYTFESGIVLKDNDKIIESNNTVEKHDTVNDRNENSSTHLRYGTESKNYYYSDKKQHINYDSYSDSYYVQQYSQPREYNNSGNPFEDQYASDFEKIADAVVGNLKDYVVVSENPDGSKKLSGAIDETQIPALVNAVSSYIMKQQLNTSYDSQKNLYTDRGLKDVYVKSVKGDAQVAKSGMLESAIIDASIIAKDDKDEIHTFTVQLAVKLKDINSTSVNEPDLTGKTVQTNYINADGGMTSGEKLDIAIYKGTYKNDILLLKDNKIVKIGERVLVVKEITEDSIKATYTESYLDGYEEYKKSAIDANIEKTLDNIDGKGDGKYHYFSTQFNYGENNREGHLGMYEPSVANINLQQANQGNSDIIPNTNLVRVAD